MIKIFALNVSEEILNKFKNLEIHKYYDKVCTPTVTIWLDDELIYTIRNPNYGRISACILELRR